MQSSSILPPSTITSAAVANETTDTNTEISIRNQSQHESHELCLDDLLRDDSYDKLMKGGNNESQLITNTTFGDSGCMVFNNMTVNSNYGLASLGNNNNNNFNMNFPPMLETINEDSIKELLGALR